MFTSKEKNFAICANCFRLTPTDKEFAKWIKYRYEEYVRETGGYSTMGACSTTPTFPSWLEQNQNRQYWQDIPYT